MEFFRGCCDLHVNAILSVQIHVTNLTNRVYGEQGNPHGISRFHCQNSYNQI